MKRLKMKPGFRVLMITGMLLVLCTIGYAQKAPRFRALILTERNKGHEPYVAAALEWMKTFAADSNFVYDVINNTEKINDAYLANYKVFIQLDYPPYMWTDEAKQAFIKYIEKGKGGGWVGFHHATLLGEYDGYTMWDWFSGFMGGIRFKDYIPGLASGTVIVEDKKHPALRGIPSPFVLDKEEWYTWDKNPRPNVHVIARVDESTYTPDSKVKMGDHPVIWSNPKMKARNIYIQMGHHPDHYKNENYQQLVRNSIFWAAGLLK